LIGISLVGVAGVSFILAMIKANGVPLVALKIWLAWVKKYWMFGIVVASGVFAVLVSQASKKAVDDKVQDHDKVNTGADSIKTKIQDVNMEANAEIKVAQERKRINEIKLKEAKKIKDPMERRKKLAELLVILLIVTVGCAPRSHEAQFISAIPDPIPVDKYIVDAQTSPQFQVPMDSSCGWDTLALPAGVLVTDSGERIEVSGGVLVSDCKAEQLVRFKSSAELFYVERNQLAIAYKALYQGATQTEKMYQEALKDQNPDLWEEVDFEAGVATGALMCIGIAYGLNEAVGD